MTDAAMRLAGGGGLLKSSPLERLRRDALSGPVMPPSNDRCLETIGKLECGLPAITVECPENLLLHEVWEMTTVVEYPLSVAGLYQYTT